uniref:CaMBD domain-containing protein n=1 Tax=Caenorhabditis japonica TaxID=281687 RepID=A0A8R1DFT6_CAEJA
MRSFEYSIHDIIEEEGSDWDSRESGGADRSRASRPSVYGKRYGVAMSNAETVRQRWKMRRKLTDLKVKLCDVTLVLAISGLILAMLDVEFTATRILERFVSTSDLSFILRSTAIVTTIALLFFLLFYHFIDIKIQLVETGTSNWRVGITSERVLNTMLELAICAICPIPETGFVAWPQLSNIAEKTRQYVNIPISVLLTLPMFLRFYITCRYMVLHSSQHQDTATRTIASLNHIAVDFRFVLKSEMYERPLFVLSMASLLFWCVVSWMLTQCERFAYPSISGFQHFADYLWFEIITFFSIGYGDVQVNTYCGRGLAMLTAIVGTLFSSTLIALISRKLILTSSEKRVNHIIAENKITNEHKNAAACVLQNTWRTVLRSRDYQKSSSRRNHHKLAKSQRILLCSVLTFRKTRWKLRMQLEEEDDYFTARRAFNETEDRLQKVRQRQSQLDGKISALFENVETLTQAVMARKCYLRQ